MSENVGDEPYLRVEEIAERLGLPLAVLLRRVEAGDVPSRLIDTDEGPRYALRLSDLGIETEETSTAAPGSGGETDDEPEGINAFGESDWTIPRAHPAGEPNREADDPAEHTILVPTWSTRPLEPQQPPVWITADPSRGTAEARPHDEPAEASDESAHGGSDDQPAAVEPTEEEGQPERHEWQPAANEEQQGDQAPWAAPADTPGSVAVPVPVETLPVSHVVEPDAAAPDAAAPDAAAPDAAAPDAAAPVAAAPVEEAFVAPSADAHPQGSTAPDLHPAEAIAPAVTVPVPARAPASSLIEPLGGPRTDLASMSLDARDLVAGLLDRWERTLEQRIYTEQRQRFQVELSARQNMVRELQMELQTARAEHAAAQAEKDRLLAAKERELADRERDLAETRRSIEEAERSGGSADTPRRRWFRARGDD
jgi:hypothetical protein